MRGMAGVEIAKNAIIRAGGDAPDVIARVDVLHIYRDILNEEISADFFFQKGAYVVVSQVARGVLSPFPSNKILAGSFSHHHQGVMPG